MVAFPAPSPNPYVMPVTQSRQETASEPFFVGGRSYETDERVVAVTVSCLVTVKLSDKEFTATIGMHEMAIARRMYEEMGGSLVPLPGYAPAVPRHRALNSEQFKAEIARLKETYRMPRENRVLEFANEFLGTEPAEQISRLQAAMKRQFEAWKQLRTLALARLVEHRTKHGDLAPVHPAVAESMCWDYLNVREIEEVAALIQPKHVDTLETINIEPTAPAAPMPSVSIEEAAKEAADELDDLDKNFAALTAAGLNEGQANQVLSAVEAAGKFGVVPEDVLAGIVGKEKVKAVRKALK